MAIVTLLSLLEVYELVYRYEKEQKDQRISDMNETGLVKQRIEKKPVEEVPAPGLELPGMN